MRLVKQLAIIVPQVKMMSIMSLVHAPTGSRNTMPCGTMANASAAINPGNQRMVSFAANRPAMKAPATPETPIRPSAMPYTVALKPSTVRIV